MRFQRYRGWSRGLADIPTQRLGGVKNYLLPKMREVNNYLLILIKEAY
jgi:hypothetical protein